MRDVQTHVARERLAGVGLPEEDLQTLRKQGFVAAEFRVRGGQRWGPYYKLRWRQNGRQRVLYLGRCETNADQIRVALHIWQQPARLEKDIQNLMKKTRKSLQSLKDTLTPPLAQDGKQWHGYHARHRRRSDRSAPLAADHEYPIPENFHQQKGVPNGHVQTRCQTRCPANEAGRDIAHGIPKSRRPPGRVPRAVAAKGGCIGGEPGADQQ